MIKTLICPLFLVNDKKHRDILKKSDKLQKLQRLPLYNESLSLSHYLNININQRYSINFDKRGILQVSYYV